MSTPAENIDTSAAGAVVPSLSAEDSWITTLGIDDPVDGSMAPLPSDEGAPQDAAPAPEPEDKPAPAAVEAQPKVVEQPKKEGDPPAVDAAPPIDAQAKAPEVDAASDVDPELTQQDNELLKALPEAQRSDARNRFKRSTFMDRYLNPDKPAAEIRQHLQERSPSRYAALETSIFAERLAKPEDFARDLYERAPEAYGPLALAVYNGDPKFFAKQVTGRDDLTPETIQTAVDFYERNKDRIEDDAPLTQLDEAKLAEMEAYFPEEVAAFRKQMETSAQLAQEHLELKKDPQSKEKQVDPAQAEATQRMAAEREVAELWDLGRNTIGSYIEKKAFDAQAGPGVYVSPEERQAAPMVALLKDFKANVLLHGLTIDGKPVLAGFEQGLTEWGKGREGFMEKVGHWGRFTEAREKQNVLEVAQSMIPYADAYYNERLKHAVFAQIDDLIKLVTEKGAIAPQFVKHTTSQLPSKAGSGSSAANGNWLVADALSRTG